MLTPLIMKLEHFLFLPDQDQGWLNGLVLRCEEFPEHSDIIREGEMPSGVFVVTAGHACGYKILPDGRRQILDFMFPGDMTERHSLLLRETDHGISPSAPRLSRGLIATGSSRRSSSVRMSASRCGGVLFNAPGFCVSGSPRSAGVMPIERVAHLLCEMYERLRLVGETIDHYYQLPVTQVELGDALGISEVYANRMLRRLQDEKLIIAEHRTIRIPDLDALKAAAAFDTRYLHLDGAPQAVRDALAVPRRMS